MTPNSNMENKKPRKSYSNQKDFNKKPFRKSTDEKNRQSEPSESKPFKKSFDKNKKRYKSSDNNQEFSKLDFAPGKTRQKRDDDFSFDKPFKKPHKKEYTDDYVKPYRRDNEETEKKPYKKKAFGSDEKKPYRKNSFNKSSKESKYNKTSKSKDDGLIRLNKYIANAGICSRREADQLIITGAVTVNGAIVTELGSKVKPNDLVKVDGKAIKAERQVYVLLNKPKDFITTSKDPQNRRTVMELVKNACKERIYPVGRLDRATTGLLLFTNDGDIAKKLTHPSHGARKIYQVVLNQPLKKEDMDQISQGLELEDGIATIDEIAYAEKGGDKKEIGIVLHSGKNRIVRRIFEHLGYEVVKLDRVSFAGLTKKNLSRGQWRFLTQEEINLLKRLK